MNHPRSGAEQGGPTDDGRAKPAEAGAPERRLQPALGKGRGGVSNSCSAAQEPGPAGANSEPRYPARPGPVRGLATLLALAAGIFCLANRVETGADDMVTKLGRIEVTARLLERPESFPQLGAYRYTYVLKYKVLKVYRPDAAGKYPLQPGDDIFVGHYKPWLPRSAIKDSDWGAAPLGGKLDHFVAGEAHRLALDYELADLAPSGALDYCFPPRTNRFFALWANPTTY